MTIVGLVLAESCTCTYYKRYSSNKQMLQAKHAQERNIVDPKMSSAQTN